MALRDAQAKTIYLKDYQPPEFLIDQSDLIIQLYEDLSYVKATLKIRANPNELAAKTNLLVLQGEGLELIDLTVDGRVLTTDQYTCANGELSIPNVPDSFELCSTVAIKPQENTSLEGLYKSRTMYCTQCEAEGFRKITYYLDRPDVMSEFNTTIEADKSRYPVLLSNGNRLAQGELPDNRHWVRWHDPFKKPAYLFAMVAGDLACIEDSFTTMSGRQVDIKIYVEDKDVDKCDHAMDSLKRAMTWDEQVYGREYDLDIFMIVAVDDFNMGAMENKGLNIFNTSCVLAKPETTTDAGFQRVEAVVAHEYFHNWSGNRVTCRDWFQLSLKEGFTVFRDAEFSADMGSRVIKRVEDVNFLRSLQFAEDGGPTAHPVQPASFMEISNFYTLTIYEKGAEIVRMIHTLLGPVLFRKGSDLYFDRHDGQAVTIEDFVSAMAEVSGRDFDQFMNWYRQAGTPRLAVSGHYDATAKTYRLDFKQSCPPTPESANKKPFHIPLKLGLVGAAGDLPLHVAGQASEQAGQTDQANQTEIVLEITEAEQSVTFENLQEHPIPSLLRGFSAPIKLEFDHTPEQLIELMRKDSDGFNRWSACNQLALSVLQGLIRDQVEKQGGRQIEGQALQLDSRLIAAYDELLANPNLDKAMLAHMLTLPSESYLSESSEVIYVEAIHGARQFVRQTLAVELGARLTTVYQSNKTTETYAADAAQIARRSLKNTALAYLLQLDKAEYIELAWQQFQQADNMTDTNAALMALLNNPAALAQDYARRALESYYTRWQGETLVVNQWFQMQAWCGLPGGLERVEGLMAHSAFDIKNPNKVRSVIGAFCAGNPINFHREDGAGYDFLVKQLAVLDELNPQIASRLLTPLTKWKQYPESKGQAMAKALERVLARPDLSKDSYEIASKALKV